MAENYKPKKIVAVYDMGDRQMECPNCHRRMFHRRTPGRPGFYCLNDKCRLHDVLYTVVKTLATLERA